MKTSVQFKSGQNTVFGKCYTVVDPADALATLVLLPGFPGNEDDVLGLGEALSLQGLNTLTFNYRGSYQSEGLFSLKHTLEDIQAAFDFLKDSETQEKLAIKPHKLLLGGWSYGGGMGLIYAALHPEIRHVFSIAGTDHGEFAREYQRNKTFATMIDGEFEMLKHPNGPMRFLDTYPIEDELLPNQSHYDLISQAANLVDRDVFLMGGWDDLESPIEDHLLPCYRKLKEQGAERVSIKMFQDDHVFQSSRSALVDAIMDWVGTF